MYIDNFTIWWWGGGGGGGGGPGCDIITCVNTPFSSRTCWTICPGGKCKGNGKAGPFSEIILTVAGPENNKVKHIYIMNILSIDVMYRRNKERYKLSNFSFSFRFFFSYSR